jgi:predicted transcriptional regulator
MNLKKLLRFLPTREPETRLTLRIPNNLYGEVQKIATALDESVHTVLIAAVRMMLEEVQSSQETKEDKK